MVTATGRRYLGRFADPPPVAIAFALLRVQAAGMMSSGPNPVVAYRRARYSFSLDRGRAIERCTCEELYTTPIRHDPAEYRRRGDLYWTTALTIENVTSDLVVATPQCRDVVGDATAADAPSTRSSKTYIRVFHTSRYRDGFVPRMHSYPKVGPWPVHFTIRTAIAGFMIWSKWPRCGLLARRLRARANHDEFETRGFRYARLSTARLFAAGNGLGFRDNFQKQNSIGIPTWRSLQSFLPFMDGAEGTAHCPDFA